MLTRRAGARSFVLAAFVEDGNDDEALENARDQ